MRRNTLIGSLIAIALTGCGSDNTTASPEITPPSESGSSNILRPHENLEIVGKNPSMHLDRYIGVKVGDGDPFLLDMSDVELPKTRPDIFQEGQHSTFDLLRYLDEQGYLELEWNEKINQYDTVDYSINGESGWNVASFPINGRIMDDGHPEVGDDRKLEFSYERVDQKILKNDHYYRIVYNPKVAARRQEVREAELQRNHGSDKVVVENVYIYKTSQVSHEFGRMAVIGPEYADIHLTNVEITPHNLRNDIYQEGVVSLTDVYASIATDPRYSEQLPEGERKVQLTYWPTLKVGPNPNEKIEVNGYALSQIAGKNQDGNAGWTPMYGEELVRHDFVRGGGHLCSDHYPDNPKADKEFCRGFGGNFLHVIPDFIVMNQGAEEVHIPWADVHFQYVGGYYGDGDMLRDDNVPVWTAKPDHYIYTKVKNNPLPDLLETTDIDQATHPLTEDHFGWKIADCGLCHSVESIHKQGDIGEVFEFVKPSSCAACHGSNGAPAGHDYNRNCFGCHHDVENHRDISINSPHIDDTSKYFPVPFSCVTCHKNPSEVTDNSTEYLEVRHEKFPYLPN